jgi:hypothetical protein
MCAWSSRRGDGWGEASFLCGLNLRRARGERIRLARVGGVASGCGHGGHPAHADGIGQVELLLMSSEMSLWNGRTLLIYSTGHQD